MAIEVKQYLRFRKGKNNAKIIRKGLYAGDPFISARRRYSLELNLTSFSTFSRWMFLLNEANAQQTLKREKAMET